MSARLFFGVTALLSFACGAAKTPERWAFSATPLSDGCGLVDAGVAVTVATMERVDRLGGLRWNLEGQTESDDSYDCDQAGAQVACFSRRVGNDVGQRLTSYLRGSFAADRQSFSGNLAVVKTCPEFQCAQPATETFPVACRSDYRFSGNVIADRYPGACPPAGTKPEAGEPALLTLYKGSEASDLRLSEMQDDGTFGEGGVLRSNPGEIALNRPTHVGSWFIVHTKSGGKLNCVGAFKVDGPQMRVVIQ